MNYENLTCPVCQNTFRDGEDIVVCPVCATPQHRECWMKNGRCANDDLHKSGFVWKRENNAVSPENQAEKAESDEADSCNNEYEAQTKNCHICSSENPCDALHCGNCGALFGQDNQQESSKKCAFCGKENSDDALHCNQCGAPLGGAGGFYGGGKQYIFGTDIEASEKIGENTAQDLATYVQASARRYLPKFKKFEEGKKLSFNFAAFFFAPYWFFYRKLYKAGAFFLVAFVTASILLSGYSNTIMEAMLEYTEKTAYNKSELTQENLDEYLEQDEKLLEEYAKKITKPALIITAVTTVLRLICALMADKLYYKKVLDDMKLISENVENQQMKMMMTARRGGLSPLAFGASLLGETALVNLLSMAADFILNL